MRKKSSTISRLLEERMGHTRGSYRTRRVSEARRRRLREDTTFDSWNDFAETMSQAKLWDKEVLDDYFTPTTLTTIYICEFTLKSDPSAKVTLQFVEVYQGGIYTAKVSGIKVDGLSTKEIEKRLQKALEQNAYPVKWTGVANR
jgi:hypothetical protein